MYDFAHNTENTYCKLCRNSSLKAYHTPTNFLLDEQKNLVGHNLVVLDLNTFCQALSASVQQTKAICPDSLVSSIRNSTIIAVIVTCLSTNTKWHQTQN